MTKNLIRFSFLKTSFSSFSMKSHNLPGVAMKMVGAELITLLYFSLDIPPTKHPIVKFVIALICL